MDPKLSKILKVALQVGAPLAAQFVPGGTMIQQSVTALITRTATSEDKDGNGIPDNEDAVLDMLLGGVRATEGLMRQDLVNDPVLQEHGAAVLKAIEAFRHQLLVRHSIQT